MGHGSVADEIKGRGRAALGDSNGARSSTSPRTGVRFRSYIDGASAHGARDLDGGAGGAALRHRARLRRVHAVSRHPRLHGSLDRAHPPLARTLPDWHREHGPADQARLRDRPGWRRARPAGRSRPRPSPPRAAAAESRSGARSGRTSRRCTRSSAGPPRRSSESLPSARGTCSASVTSTICSSVSGRGSTPSTARCRRGSARHGVAIVPDPQGRWRLDLCKARWRARRSR